MTDTLDLEALAKSGFAKSPWAVCDMGNNLPEIIEASDAETIGWATETGEKATAERWANAELMAAAPALLQRAIEERDKRIELEAEVERLREALRRERASVEKDAVLRRVVREKDDALNRAQTFKGHVKNLVSAYDSQNPMRTAVMHDPSCLCLRCFMDHAKAALSGDGETE